MKFGIICYPDKEINEIISACHENHIETVIIDFFSPEWLAQCSKDIDGYIVRPPCTLQEHKMIYDERMYFINKILKKPIYPSLNELYTYENKRNMSLFLETYNLPHAKTKIYLDKKSLNQDLDKIKYPIVVKSNIGASGSGVYIAKNVSELKKYSRKIFGYFHPSLSIGLSPKIKYKGIKVPLIGAAQKHFIILQDYINLKHEWRMIRIGDNYFGHKKLIGKNGFASGSLLVGWDTPPQELLELVFQATETMGMECMVLDIFEDQNNNYFINEMQTIIGAERPYQMKINGIPGRYKKMNKKYIFEAGEHCKNKCWNLRVEHFISKINKRDYE